MSSGGSYDPRVVEPAIYERWLSEKCFHAQPDPSRRPYAIVIPPPNVTGALHLGHALNNTLQDILIRRARMMGRVVCWLPGTDHAGIATQAVVEKRLKEEENLSRHEVGREGLVERIWAWKDEYQKRILSQLRAMGCSCDWDRERFTLDEVCQRAVYETFFRFFEDGLIFRGQRLVNWDTHLQTAVADDEIVPEKVKGSLWHYRYPVLPAGLGASSISNAPKTVPEDEVAKAYARATAEDAQPGKDYLVIATTRPETMLGDTAIAVHPRDARYAHLIGKHVMLPLQNKALPVIADGQLVDPEFGTGCVKVTPAHDPNDYATGQRHGLPSINILNKDGSINEQGGAYEGLERYVARKRVVADLEAQGLLEEVRPHEMNVGHSDRSKTPIEPLLSEQWFVKMESLANDALEAVRDERVRFFPPRYAKTYLDWLGEKRDWCISRQLWWGHRIPVWSKAQLSTDEQQETLELLIGLGDGAAAVQFVDAATGTTTATPQPQPVDAYVCVRVPLGANGKAADRALSAAGFEQDPDVLDTWFSSALWPHSTFGWPGESGADATGSAANHGNGHPEAPTELEYFYPGNVLCTARDIISLWVARMIMTGLYNLKRVPFPHVYIHAVIQDGQGRRMSKSLGNGVDPMDLIGMYGADAMRFTLAQLAGETQDIRIPVKKGTTPDGREVNTSDRFELGRNFANKLWQASTGFVIGNLDGYDPQPLDAQTLPLEDRWILARLQRTIAEVDRRLNAYQFNEAANALYAFFWSEVCDWYIELVKPRLFTRNEAGENVTLRDAAARQAQQVLAWIVDQSLRLLHPMIPFVTERLWEELGKAAPKRGIVRVDATDGMLIHAAWPTVDAALRDDRVEAELATLQDVIRAIREVRNRVNGIRAAARETALKSLPRAVIKADEGNLAALSQSQAVIERLAQVDAVEIGVDIDKPAESASTVFAGYEVYVPLSGLADLDMERERLTKERDEVAGHIKRIRGKLSNESFVAKAPAAVVEQERERLSEHEQRLTAIERNLAELGG